jgi:hypothetical protein
MNWYEILQKVGAGQPLNDDERNYIRDWSPENKQREFMELEGANHKLNETMQALQQQLVQAENDKNTAAAQLLEMRFRSSVNQIASKYNFSDADYLEFKLKHAGIDIGDEHAATGFMETLKQTSPKLFKVNVMPGSGNTTGHIPEPPRHNSTLESLIAAAPIIKP